MKVALFITFLLLCSCASSYKATQESTFGTQPKEYGDVVCYVLDYQHKDQIGANVFIDGQATIGGVVLPQTRCAEIHCVPSGKQTLVVRLVGYEFAIEVDIVGNVTNEFVLQLPQMEYNPTSFCFLPNPHLSMGYDAEVIGTRRVVQYLTLSERAKHRVSTSVPRSDKEVVLVGVSTY